MTPTEKALDALESEWQEGHMVPSNYKEIRTHIEQSDPQKIREQVLDEVERELELISANSRLDGYSELIERKTLRKALSRIRSLKSKDLGLTDPQDQDTLRDQEAEGGDPVDRIEKAMSELQEVRKAGAPEKVKGYQDGLERAVEIVDQELYDRDATSSSRTNSLSRILLHLRSELETAPEKVKGGEGGITNDDIDEAIAVAERDQLFDAVEKFGSKMKSRLIEKLNEGFRGWNDDVYFIDEGKRDVIARIQKNIEQEDWVDVANLAMMLDRHKPAPSQPDSEGTREPRVEQEEAMGALSRSWNWMLPTSRDTLRRFIEQGTREDGIRECVGVLEAIRQEYHHAGHEGIQRSAIYHAKRRLTALLDAPSQPELTWEDVPVKTPFYCGDTWYIKANDYWSMDENGAVFKPNDFGPGSGGREITSIDQAEGES